MARIKDLWYSARLDPATGEKTPTKRHGKGKRWLLVYRDPAGAERAEAFEKKPAAEKRLTDVKADLQRGEYVDIRGGQLPFNQLADMWLESRLGVAASTLDRDRRRIVPVLKDKFGREQIARILPSHVKAWRKARSETCSAGTINLEMSVLSAILQTAVDDDLLRKNPCAKIGDLPVDKTVVPPWPLVTVRQLLDVFSDTRPHLWSIPALAFGAGLRQGEAFGVAVDDIEFLKRRLQVRRQVNYVGRRPVFSPPKRNSFGVIPLEPELCALLAAHIAEHEPVEVTLPWVARNAKPGETRTVELIAVGLKGAPQRQTDFNRHTWHPALRAVGITPDGKATGMHQLRHAYASYLVAEGVPITAVAERMRNSLQQTVNTYAHPIVEESIPRAVASVFSAEGPTTAAITS